MNRSGAGNQQVLQLNNSDTTAGTQIVKLAFGSSGSTKASINAAVYGNDYLAFNTGSDTERMRLTGTGLGIGTSSPTNTLHVVGSGDSVARISATSDTNLTFSETTANKHWNLKPSAGDFYFQYSGTAYNSGYSNLLTIKSTGNVGIGTTSPSQLLHLSVSSGINYIRTSNGTVDYYNGINSSNEIYIGSTTTHPITFRIGDSEKTRIDTSGRLLVGTSTNSNVSTACFASRSDGAASAWVYLQTTETTPANGNTIGSLVFNSTGNTSINSSAYIICQRDGGTWTNTTSMPGRLVFSTTADGASSPTERMRITKDGNINVSVGAIGQFTVSGSNNVARFEATSLSSRIITINQNADGDVVVFDKSNAAQGSISISGSTVSYNGAHLSRWSQLTSGAERIEILRGSVLSNLDEMCEWINPSKDAVLWKEGDELPEGVEVGDVKEPAELGGPQDNEQLNRMKVSDVEGDKNVSGVFQSWDDGRRHLHQRLLLRDDG
jgi:hypothetical protein